MERRLLWPGGLLRPGRVRTVSVRSITYILYGYHRTVPFCGPARAAAAAERLPGAELAFGDPEGGERRQDGQAGRGGQEAAGGTSGGPAAACGGEPPGQADHDVGRSGYRQQDQRGADRGDRGRRVAVAAGRGGQEAGLQDGG